MSVKKSIGVITVMLIGLVGTYVGVQSLQSDCGTEGRSVASIWNETLLDAIRRDFPAPTVHSRNLYHTSAAMWDTWAAYDVDVTGVFVNETQTAINVEEAREEAVSFAAYTILKERYAKSSGSVASLAEFDDTLESLCFSPDGSGIEGSPAAFGESVANTILRESLQDGSLEESDYVDDSYVAVNEPLDVADSGTEMAEPNRWQPLALPEQTTQNGIKLDAATQEYIGPNWGFVTPFAIEPDKENGLPYDPGEPPLFGTDTEQDFVKGASETAKLSALLDPTSDKTIDISPAAIGDVNLGTYSANGRDENPVTGEVYEPNVVLEADYGRVIAEYWADGPDSETPPGHWNTLLLEVGDTLEEDGNLTIDGNTVERFEWDVKLMLAMNGALHDTAIAVWGAKAHYDYARPISMIRYLGEKGLLDETPGSIETITDQSSAAGERHSELADYVGEQAVLSWLGEPSNPRMMVGGVGWIRAADWVPYQRESFVSPAFAAYVSGHSGFSRAAAVVMAEFTGSEYFPGGLGTHTVAVGNLLHEQGPTESVTLQWATYTDAADQAGLSRLYGGIHVQADDLNGRVMGAEIGELAANHARTFFDTP